MPHITTDDGVKLYYDEAGSGTPIIFVHEFAGDHRSWEPQMRHFSRRYRAITYSARGYLPSDVPDEPDAYSQKRACDDIRAVMDGLNIDVAHVIGLSMGGFATLHFGFDYPDRALSLVVGGCGYGAEPDKREQFRAETMATAEKIRHEGMEKAGRIYALGPTRVQFQNKDLRGWQEFESQLRDHSTQGSVNTMMGVQRLRPSLYELEDKMLSLTVPTLIINGDEDEPCLDPG
ncbi:MAG: alpha/beta hydrolase, partial [Rhodospirillaceae bacterium]|nr:alpha/beta hydrolase [Rhodospirillaceae bacterium]